MGEGVGLRTRGVSGRTEKALRLLNGLRSRSRGRGFINTSYRVTGSRARKEVGRYMEATGSCC